MIIGVLACGFNCSEYFNQVLEPWIQYKKKHSNLIISAVNGAFKENQVLPNDNTKELMLHAFNTKQIDHVAFPVGSFDEAAMRNVALSPLLVAKVDYIILLDFDEIYTLEQIEKIFEFIARDPFTTWFKIHFKNYIIDKKHYILNFCPPRIFRVNMDHIFLSHFYYDNDPIYKGAAREYSYKEWSSMEIPVAVALVNHFSWVGSPERLQQKLKYQNAHFNGICSYKWDDEKNQLALNLDFYKKYNVPIPTIYEE